MTSEQTNHADNEVSGNEAGPDVADANADGATGAAASEAAPQVDAADIAATPSNAGMSNAELVEAALAEDTGPKKRWYVVQAYSGYENKVRLSLEERIKNSGISDQFGDILIPKENVQEARAGKKRLTSRNFYPGYIFVEMTLTDEAWHLLKNTPKVSGFVGGRHPAPVPQSEINAIAQQVADGVAKPTPRVVFEQGDHVRVTDGAFANFTGTIEEVIPAKQKVRVLVSIFGRATPVELDYVQVEKTA